MVTAGIFPFKENSHGRAGNRTRDLMISSQRLWPLDHEGGRNQNIKYVFQNAVNKMEIVYEVMKVTDYILSL